MRGKISIVLALSYVLLHNANCEGEAAPKNATVVNTTTQAPNATASPSIPANTTSASTPVSPASNATSKAPLSKPSNSSSLSSKLICYYNKLAENRTDPAVKYNLTDVDSSLCTHVIYSFATIDLDNLSIRNDSLSENYENVVALKEKGVIVLLSLGGSSTVDSSESEKFSKIVNEGADRNTFVKNVVHFLKDHKFQGLDVNWNYPSCWNGYCQQGRPADKGNFENLLKELHAAFHFYKLILSVSVSPLEQIAEKSYDVNGIARNVDFINLLAYDYNNLTFESTVLHSPMSSVASTVNYWKSKGVSTNKLIVGIPTFGRTFTLANVEWNTTKSAAKIGTPTGIGEAGMAAYFEVCKGLNYQMVEHEGSYAYKGNQWVSFDDPPTATHKGEFIKNNDLGGAMIWSLDTDDFNGQCGQGKYPLIKALRSSLGLDTNKTA